MIWYDIFVNCNWVVTRWQYTFTHKQYIEQYKINNTCTCRNQSSSFLHTVHVVPRCRAPNPCLPQQQDTIPYVVKKKTSVLRSWRWAKVCPKHVELILEINKTVTVACRWFLYYLTYMRQLFLTKYIFNFILILVKHNLWQLLIYYKFRFCGALLRVSFRS